MSSTNQPFSLLQLLRQQLDAARAQDGAIRASNDEGTPIEVPITGRTISSAYEQLRNAAEYAEEHLLLQRAIKRFYNRNFTFVNMRHSRMDSIGGELIVELTQAGYLRNGHFSSHTALKIRHLTEAYTQTYLQLRDAHIPRDTALDWSLSVLAVEVEAILSPHSYYNAIAYSAYQHYLQLFQKEELVENKEESDQYELCLYLAVHKALLKSDLPEARTDLTHMYHQSPQDIQSFIHFNRTVDALYTSPLTNRLKRVVSKYAAPIRVLMSLVEDRDDVPELLLDRQAFMEAYSHQVSKEYRRVRTRLTKGIIKSIIFIFITKVIIGISVEVPYDYLIMGAIKYTPLAINLLFPPLYMASLKLGIKVPSRANATVLNEYMDQVLFTNTQPSLQPFHDTLRTASLPTKWLFTILFFVPFAITLYVLHLLHFNPVQMIVFFTFLSTASFLGFRLSTMVRELELITRPIGLLSGFRDFFYLPFILVGQWLSGKYAKLNVVAYFLDIAIELPLKTVLRLFRQWTRFLNEKHEEIY